MTQKNHIPLEILEACAQAAYEATQKHYDKCAGVNCNVPGMSYALAYQSWNVQQRVLKDVRAVLLGNRTAEDLHYAWALRKEKTFGPKNWRKKAPTAAYSFQNLTPEDRKGYELFVSTVKKTYEQMVLKSIKGKDMSKANLHDHLKSILDRSLICKLVTFNGQNHVTVYFNNLRDSNEFYDLLKNL
jgi:hypothetical protein